MHEARVQVEKKGENEIPMGEKEKGEGSKIVRKKVSSFWGGGKCNVPRGWPSVE